MSVNVGLLVVGNEILDGVVLDTNSQWVIKQLRPLNLQVRERMTVRDDVSDMSMALRRLVSDRCALVITMGGLGPTHDDKTLSGVAEAFGLPLELNPDALDIVTRRYRELHEGGIVDTAEITASRRKMAILPRGARPLDNRVGSAPGVSLVVEGVRVICLPGVPREMMWIFENEVLDILKGMVRGAYAERFITLPLKDESLLAPIIDEVMRQVPSVYVKSMVKPLGERGIRIWISSVGESQEVVEKRLELAEKKLTQMVEEGVTIV